MILYWSQDNGQFYEPTAVDGALNQYGETQPVEGFYRYAVTDVITLTPRHCCAIDGDILEALLASGQATAIDKH